jgi:DNA-binding SARP family transcriptional activator/tetratricopeptide (TPR) repeat protein
MIRLRLLGEFVVERDGAPVATTGPTARLLAHLALAAGPVDRSALAARFWPDAAEPAARANLRTAVWSLRKALGEEAVLTTRTAVGLDPAVCWVDVLDVADLAVTRPEEAAALCRGELLGFLNEDWVLTERQEQLRREAALFDELIGRAQRAEDYVGAVGWARRRCALSPLDEPAHCVLLRAMAAAGDRAGAVAAGREFVERLRAELGVGPVAATRAALAELADAPIAPVRGGPGGQAALFGRRRELAVLNEAWSMARAGRGRVVVLTGEGGIGKTRLVTELARRSAQGGACVAMGAGLDVGGEAPLAVWQELARELVGQVPEPSPTVTWPLELGRLSPDLSVVLGGVGRPPHVAAPELERLRIFDAVLRLVEWAAAARPLLLVAEDVHRADRASLALCAHIGRRVSELPVLFVLTRRDRPVRSDTDALVADLFGRGMVVEEIELGPMADAELAAVARSVAPLNDGAVDRVLAVAEGSPLLAVESARMLASGSVDPPQNLRSAVRAATRALPTGARELVESLAAAGRELTAPELTALALPDLVGARELALQTGLLRRERGGLRFRHALLAEAARIDLTDRQQRHEQVALAVEAAARPGDPTVAAEVARHLKLAGRDDLAADRWQRAATHARDMGALTEAAEFWTEAVQAAPDVAAYRLGRAEVLGWLGRPEEFEQEWRAALGVATPEDFAAAWARRGLVLRSVICHPSASLEAYRQAWQVLRPDSSIALRIAILAGLAWGEAAAGDPVAGGEWLTRLTDTLADPDDSTAAEIHHVRLMALTRLGRFNEVEAIAEQGTQCAVRAGRIDLAYGLGLHAACALSSSGDFAGALRAVDTAVAATRGVPVLAVPCHAGRAFVLARIGRLDEACAEADEQLAAAERMDSPELLAVARHDAGLIALAAARHARAAELLAAALDAGAKVNRSAARLARAEALVGAGDPDAATAEVRGAALEPSRTGDQSWALVHRMSRVQGLIALARGDASTARRRLTEARDGWLRVPAPTAGEEFMTAFVDLGRPPIVGLVEPAREIERLARELSELS